MLKTDKVYEMLKREGLQLSPGTHLKLSGIGTLFLCNDDAATAEEYWMHEAATPEEMYAYLKQENLTELEVF